MKRIGLKLAILAMVASTVATVPALAGESAAVRNCTWCHGAEAQGYTVAPRLAGQQPQYIMSQIQSFHEHTRDNPFSRQYMWSAVAALSPAAARDLANYLASIPPKPANDGDSALASKGKRIFMEGIPEANIVSCYACHGPNGEGVRDIPRLGGLAYFYVKARLEQWGQGYHSTAGSPMPLVASHLGPDEIEALASYLSFVK
ncbi:MAG: c-type cytochrome [Bradyrhizobium sp.]|jgi:cytochrome c553|uniref:c-type cytochrome n=2 Tax=Bradyrhizobium sp. TaxID=376 RepID=UPI003BB21B73